MNRWDGMGVCFLLFFGGRIPGRCTYIFIHLLAPTLSSFHFTSFFFCFFFVVSAGIGIIIDFIHSCTDTRFLSSTTL